MLGVIAFQGTGLLHALHVLLEHDHTGHSCSTEARHLEDDTCPSSRASETHSGYPALDEQADKHSHHPAACQICSAIVGLKALAADVEYEPPIYLPQVGRNLRPAGAAHVSPLLSDKAPRAPPTCGLSISV